ncbi:LysR family transcriptional regulator [Allofrancisella guangzhouensis]|uniref:Hydrogen peroxide-inducible genes activator n=1 Tax=Allofrancisella guangzhouensis TaxID=594679 RepID=A0A0A8E5G1_9GAMM|nr:LysR substrate-binding domain-containing protein [Allofrancisella guangzhouensis]AJC49184.1 hydrogen peroxide-inducible genes activator [Allofrancisella guangzhouensis]MBK2026646.1 LysR family transcriptional regulator [Allofrancisella guangzhouensis]MBK2044429.1 LysR family transcriptional regulator [Allofrancisella guangzhouensis]MBK2045363.1 LysR family transcriptional regulator [Allofrancisella guangzhouensis]
MNTRTLEYIIAVHETKSFITASEKCFVSQPALSMQIKKFEDSLGLQIFERGTKQIFITEAGKKIIIQAYKIIAEVKNLTKIANIYLAGNKINISIGAFPTICPYIMPKVLPSIKQQIPNLSISIIEEKTDILINMLEHGKLDFVLLADTIDHNQLISKKLFDDRFFIAVANTNELSKKKSLTTAEIIKENLMILDEGHCLRDQTLKLCSLNEYNNSNFKGSSLETLRQMVSIDEGITLIPEIACTQMDNISYLAINDPKFKREIFLVMRKNSIYSEIFNQLATIIVKHH